MKEYAQRSLEWFKGLSTAAKAAVIGGLLILTILAVTISPLLILVFLVAAAVYGFLALRQYGRDGDARTPGIKALGCVAAALLFVALTAVFHGNDTTEIADRERVPTEEPQQQQNQEPQQENENQPEEDAQEQEQQREEGNREQNEQENQPEEEQAQEENQEPQEEEEQGLFEGMFEDPEEESGPVEEPEEIVLSGSGDTVTDPVQVEEGLGVINMAHQGQGNFAIEEVNGAVDEFDTLLVNEIGNYTGANASNLLGGEMVLDVQADGPWEIVIEQPRANEGSDQRAFEGDTDAVSGLIELESGNVTVDMEHQGQGNFAVELLDENGVQAGWDSLVANEIGSYTGSNSVEIPDDGTYILDIEADGPWAIRLN